LQEVKQHLYHRAFDKAFGRPEYLQAYAARWSPSRALGYLEIFRNVVEFFNQGAEESEFTSQDAQTSETKAQLKAVCLGGGAGAEVCAFAGLHQLLTAAHSNTNQKDTVNGQIQIQVTAYDIAKWDDVLETLRHSLTTPPLLSKYASAAAKAANVEIIRPSSFALDFLHCDLLALSTSTLTSSQFQESVSNANLITLMFTLNELYTVSMPATQTFLFELTTATKKGTLLLVVDSPGSYSTITLNGQEKKYPMHWLMDHTLLNVVERTAELSKAADAQSTDAPGSTSRWAKLVSEESRWFRLPGGLKYPLELENMRYQMHLYRRL